MGDRLPQRQIWLENALQGLAFWIGHRHAMFRNYPLPEGALVAEACNLIQANLPRDLVLLPECQYRNLVAAGSFVPDVGPKARADLVICAQGQELSREGNVSEEVVFVFEVKRGSAATQSIDDDLKRLHSLLTIARNGVRAFLLVVAEGRAPRRFVRDGRSILEWQEIPGRDGRFKVRRSVKAAASFDRRETAHYVCLVEVFLKGQRAQKI